MSACCCASDASRRTVRSVSSANLRMPDKLYFSPRKSISNSARSAVYSCQFASSISNVSISSLNVRAASSIRRVKSLPYFPQCQVGTASAETAWKPLRSHSRAVISVELLFGFEISSLTFCVKKCVSRFSIVWHSLYGCVPVLLPPLEHRLRKVAASTCSREFCRLYEAPQGQGTCRSSLNLVNVPEKNS